MCLADYCDIMRCEVLASQVMSSLFLNDDGQGRTDLEIWREATAYRTALMPAGPRDLARVHPPSTRGRRPPPTPSPLCKRVSQCDDMIHDGQVLLHEGQSNGSPSSFLV